MNGFVMPDGRKLMVDPLREKSVKDRENSREEARESMQRRNTDDVAIIRYLYLAQEFSFEDIAYLMGGDVTPEMLNLVFVRQKTKFTAKDGIENLCRKLGVPGSILKLFARTWIDMEPGREQLPYFIPMLSNTGDEIADEKMWFSVRWLSERFRSIDNLAMFKVPDNMLYSLDIQMGDMVFLDRSENALKFQQDSIYLVRGYDEVARLRQARITIIDKRKKPELQYIIPDVQNATLPMDQVNPANIFGKVIYKFAQCA